MKQTFDPAIEQGQDTSPLSHPFRVSALSNRKPTRFELKPDAAMRRKIAAYLNILAVKALHFRGVITPIGRRDFTLEADLTAVVEQACSLTLVPVRVELKESIIRRFIDGMEMPEGDEAEMPEDDTAEPLGEVIDPGHLALEAITLGLPLYPRAADAALATTTFAPPGVTPLEEADLKPFAGLAALKAKLSGATESDSGNSMTEKNEGDAANDVEKKGDD
jgi:uncharacterized metal-binding protein YceD (DUF177 family)